MRLLSLLAVAVALAGCSTAGPFVTNISSDGQGGLAIEKCMVKMNAFLGTVTNANCSSMAIKK